MPATRSRRDPATSGQPPAGPAWWPRCLGRMLTCWLCARMISRRRTASGICGARRLPKASVLVCANPSCQHEQFRAPIRPLFLVRARLLGRQHRGPGALFHDCRLCRAASRRRCGKRVFRKPASKWIDYIIIAALAVSTSLMLDSRRTPAPREHRRDENWKMPVVYARRLGAGGPWCRRRDFLSINEHWLPAA